MKKIMLASAALLALLCLFGCGGKNEEGAAEENVSEPASKKTETDFYLVNMTDMEIHGLYISVSNMESWSGSLLDKNRIFRRGDELPVTYARLSPNEMYDIKCEDSSGDTLCFTELDLARAGKVVLAVDESGHTVTAVTEKEIEETEETEETSGETETEYTTAQ